MKKKIILFFDSIILYIVFNAIIVNAQIPFYVSQWGFIGGRTGGWQVSVDTLSGNTSIGGDTSIVFDTWSAIRGGFNTVTATYEKPIVVTGTMEFIGAGFENWSGLRYGLFYHDSAGSLTNVGTDSARWTGYENKAYGYMFAPHSGTNDQVSWTNSGNGTQGVIRYGNWLSTYGPNLSLGVIFQKTCKCSCSCRKI